jgi:hypothetical protein
MTVLDLTTTLDLSDEEMDSYLSLCLSAKDVTPADRKKLSGLLKFYAKKKHPLAAAAFTPWATMPSWNTLSSRYEASETITLAPAAQSAWMFAANCAWPPDAVAK